MKQFIFAACAAVIGFAAPLWAQDNPVVVELYTSQGCSSCPPADRILHELADRDDVIALALHVDYWDYIGWEDPFGSSAHADRQRAYAREGGRRTIYTPEMIVNGTTDIVGAKPMKLSEAIAAHAQMAAKVDLEIARTGGELTIQARALEALEAPITVHMLRYSPRERTEIKRGENRGKTLEYANVVEGWTVLGEWDGTSELRMSAAMSGDKPCVVILQRGEAGPILAAARLK
ncbi:MAG: DUF1223 domain-containing protein [Pseudomonadota bacterium]